MTSHMIDFVRTFFWYVGRTGPVLEVGSYSESQQEHLNLRTAFAPGTPYLGVDVLDGPGVDRRMDLLDPVQVDAVYAEFTPAIVLCLYVVEHVWDIGRAAAALGDMWKRNPESWLWIATHQNQPYHGTDKYGDYWRLTASGLGRLMDDAGVPDVKVFVLNGSTNPEDVVAVRQPFSEIWPEEAVMKITSTIFLTSSQKWERYR